MENQSDRDSTTPDDAAQALSAATASLTKAKQRSEPGAWYYPSWGFLCALVFWANIASGAWIMVILAVAIVGLIFMLRVEVATRRVRPPVRFSTHDRESWTNVIAAVAIFAALIASRSFNTTLSWFLGGAAMVILGLLMTLRSRNKASGGRAS